MRAHVEAGDSRAVDSVLPRTQVPHLGLGLGELILKMSHSEIREMLLGHLPSVLRYLLVERRLKRKEYEHQRIKSESNT